MVRKRYKPEGIVTKLRQLDALISQGSAVCREIDSSSLSSLLVALRFHYSLTWMIKFRFGPHFPVATKPA